LVNAIYPKFPCFPLNLAVFGEFSHTFPNSKTIDFKKCKYKLLFESNQLSLFRNKTGLPICALCTNYERFFLHVHDFSKSLKNVVQNSIVSIF